MQSIISEQFPGLAPFYVLMESIADMRFVIKDRQHRFVYVNPCWLEGMGFRSAAEVVGKTVHDVFPGWRADRYQREEKRVVAESYLYDYEEFLLNSEGELERWRTVKAPWIENGELKGSVNIGTRLGSKDLEQRSDEIPQMVQTLAAKACLPINVQEIAQSLGMSQRSLERKFRAEMGMSPQQFRIKCRILRAKKLLKSGVRVAEAASACGFSDQSHFSKSFLKHTGTSPSAWAGEIR